MNKIISKYFLETNKYFFRIFIIGLGILVIGAAYSWAKRLNGMGWIVYSGIAFLWLTFEYKRYNKKDTVK